MRGIFREIPTLPSQYAVLVGWASELPVMVKMRTLLKKQCPQSDDPDFWDVWTRSRDRRISNPLVLVSVTFLIDSMT